MAYSILPAVLSKAIPLRCPIEPVDTRVQFQPDTGPGIIWPMMTQEPYTIGVSGLKLETYQRLALEDFGVTTLVGWALPFDWVDPWPGAGTLSFQFLAKPSYLPISPAGNRNGRPEQVLYDTAFKLLWRPWYPPAQVG